MVTSTVSTRPRAMRRAGQTGPGMTHQDSVRVRPVGCPRATRRPKTGICATDGANLARGVGHRPLGVLVSAWPAPALASSFELLMMLIRTGRGGHASEAQCEPRYQAAPQLGQDARGIGSIRRSIDKIRSCRNWCNLLVRAGNGNVPYHPCHGSGRRLTLAVSPGQQMTIALLWPCGVAPAPPKLALSPQQSPEIVISHRNIISKNAL
jgi:hypothetical protein